MNSRCVNFIFSSGVGNILYDLDYSCWEILYLISCINHLKSWIVGGCIYHGITIMEFGFLHALG